VVIDHLSQSSQCGFPLSSSKGTAVLGSVALGAVSLSIVWVVWAVFILELVVVWLGYRPSFHGTERSVFVTKPVRIPSVVALPKWKRGGIVTAQLSS
jgi:hypothetical protein